MGLTLVYFYGCVSGPGHFWIGEGLRNLRPDEGDGWRGPNGCPWAARSYGGLGIDGTLPPRSISPTEADSVGDGMPRTYEVAQGRAKLHVVNGWTAIGFWDRTQDRRGGCNANFVLHEVVGVDFAEMLKRSRAAFPEIFERFPFEVVEHRPTILPGAPT